MQFFIKWSCLNIIEFIVFAFWGTIQVCLNVLWPAECESHNPVGSWSPHDRFPRESVLVYFWPHCIFLMYLFQSMSSCIRRRNSPIFVPQENVICDQDAEEKHWWCAAKDHAARAQGPSSKGLYYKA